MQLTPEYVAKMIADGKSAAEIGAKFGKHRGAILRYAVRHNLSWKRQGRPIPDDFAQVMPTMSKVAAIKHYACSTDTLARWIEESGVKPKPHAYPVFSHDELAKAYTGSVNEAAKTLGIDRNAASRQLRQAGLLRDTPRQPKPKPQPKPKRKPNDGFIIKQQPHQRPQRDLSIIGQAVEFLRTLGPVSRCDASGKVIETGKFWRRGNAYPLTNDDIIERASRLGWTLVTV